MDLKYRADIDGLRCFAILPVVLFHAFPQFIPGGYIGVDVFFVISGFLITSIIYREASEGRFSFLRFYDRRIRRIFPALFFMLAVVCVLSVIVLIPSDLTRFGRSLLPAAAFWSNIYFWQAADYFAESSDTLPLLHTWSLAVEEQFYIFFPPILLVALRFMGRTGLIWLMLAGFVISLAVSSVGVYQVPRVTFYFLPTRAWELLLGALIAVPFLPRPSPRVGKALAACGVAMILVAAFAFGPATPFPGLYAMLPCLGAAFVIYGGLTASAGPAYRVLAAAPIVYVGRISYSLYLWHWPLLVLGRLHFGGSLTPLQASVLVALSFAMAVISLRFVEAPFRRSYQKRTAMRSMFAGAGAIAVTAVVGALFVRTDGLPWRAPAETLAAEASQDDRNPLRHRCLVSSPMSLSPQRMPPLKGCLAGPGAGEGRYEVVVWGDSMADALVPGVIDMVADRGWTVREIGMQGCPPLVDVEIVAVRQAQRGERCQEFNRWAVDLIRSSPDLKMVVIAGRWSVWSEGGVATADPRYLTDNENQELSLDNSRRVFRKSLAAAVEAVARPGMPVVLVSQPPEYTIPSWRCIAYASFQGEDTDQCGAVDRAVATETVQYSDTVVREIGASLPNVLTVISSDVLCSDAVCLTREGDSLLYADGTHLSSTGGRRLMKETSMVQPDS